MKDYRPPTNAIFGAMTSDGLDDESETPPEATGTRENTPTNGKAFISVHRIISSCLKNLASDCSIGFSG
jgi:hypothetical protein